MKKKKGFTLVELVIVIAVIAVLAAVLIPTFSSIMDKAHDSADVQLVRNMNTVLATNTDGDVTASAENIRKLLKDNGITSIETKNSDIAIVYNKKTKQFERMDVEKTFKNADGVIVVKAEEPKTIFTNDPYSAEEIFEDRIVVSTGGNDLAEALYDLHKIPGNLDTTEKFNKYISNVIKKLDDFEEAQQKVISVMKITAFVDEAGKVHRVTFDGTEAVDGTPLLADRIVFNEDLKEFDISKLADDSIKFKGIVIVPDTLEKISLDGNIGDIDDKVLLVGNDETLRKFVSEGGNRRELVLSDTTIESAKADSYNKYVTVTHNKNVVSSSKLSSYTLPTDIVNILIRRWIFLGWSKTYGGEVIEKLDSSDFTDGELTLYAQMEQLVQCTVNSAIALKINFREPGTKFEENEPTVKMLTSADKNFPIYQPNGTYYLYPTLDDYGNLKVSTINFYVRSTTLIRVFDVAFAATADAMWWIGNLIIQRPQQKLRTTKSASASVQGNLGGRFFSSLQPLGKNPHGKNHFNPLDKTTTLWAKIIPTS